VDLVVESPGGTFRHGGFLFVAADALADSFSAPAGTRLSRSPTSGYCVETRRNWEERWAAPFRARAKLTKSETLKNKMKEPNGYLRFPSVGVKHVGIACRSCYFRMPSASCSGPAVGGRFA
jgi:hypothetical protein